MASAPCLNDETLATFLSDPDAISLIDEPAFDWAVDAAFRRYVDVVAVTDPQARAMATAFADHPLFYGGLDILYVWMRLSYTRLQSSR